MKPVRTVLFALLASVALAAPQEPVYELLWKPTKDEVLDYRLELQIDVEEFEFLYNTDIEMKVLNVEANGDYELQTTTRNTKIRFKSEEDDEELVPSEPEPKIEKYNAKGIRIGKEEAEAEEDETPVARILAEVTDFSAPEKPVKKGEKWTKEIPESHAKLEYEVVGTESKDEEELVRIDYKYEQTEGSEPVKATGTYRLLKKNYSVADFTAEVENFKMDKNAPAGKAKLNMKRN